MGRMCPPAESLDQAGRFLIALLRDIGDHHAGALARERYCRGAADAVRRTRHERDLPRKVSILVRHRFLLLFDLVVSQPLPVVGACYATHPWPIPTTRT